MNKEMLCELLNAYDQATDKIICQYLGIALRRAVDLYVTAKSGEDNPTDLIDEEIRAGRTVSKVSAVKMYRDRTGKNLKDSKEAIENYFEKNGLQFHSTFDESNRSLLASVNY